MKTTLFAAATAVIIAGCASAPSAPYFAPQATIMGANSEDVKIQVSQRCISGGGYIEQNTPNMLICAKEMPDNGAGFWYQVLMVPRYATKPRLKARYNISQGSDRVFITVDTFIQFQNAYGQDNVDPIRNAEVSRMAQSMLDSIRADLESQTATAPPTSDPTSSATTPVAQPQPTPAHQPQQQRYEPDPAKRCEACSRIGTP